MYYLEGSSSGPAINPSGWLRSMIARSLVMVLVFLPSCEVEIRRNGDSRIRLPLYFTPFSSWTCSSSCRRTSSSRVSIVVDKVQVVFGGPMAGRHDIPGVLDRFELGSGQLDEDRAFGTTLGRQLLYDKAKTWT